MSDVPQRPTVAGSVGTSFRRIRNVEKRRIWPSEWHCVRPVSPAADWSATQTYYVGDVVSLAGNGYRCITYHLNQSPPDTAYWEPIEDDPYSVEFAGAWANIGGDLDPTAYRFNQGDTDLRINATGGEATSDSLIFTITAPQFIPDLTKRVIGTVGSSQAAIDLMGAQTAQAGQVIFRSAIGGVAWANAGAGCDPPALFHLQLNGPDYDIETINAASGDITASTPTMSGSEEIVQILAAVYRASTPTVALLAVRTGDDTSALASIVRSTGVITVIGETFGSGEWLDALAWIGGTLYGARGGGTPSDLYTIDPDTGAATSVGATGYAIDALAYTGETLYGATSSDDGTDPSSLITINPATGAATLIGALGGDAPSSVSDMAFSGGVLYGWDKDSGGLMTINTGTGVATLVQLLTSDYGGGIYFVSSSDAGAGTLVELEIGQCLNVTDLGGGRILLEGCCQRGAASIINADDSVFTAPDNQTWANHPSGNTYRNWHFALDSLDVVSDIDGLSISGGDLVLPAGRFQIVVGMAVSLPPQTVTRYFWQLWGLTGASSTSVYAGPEMTLNARNGFAFDSIVWVEESSGSYEFPSGGTVSFSLMENTNTGILSVARTMNLTVIELP